LGRRPPDQADERLHHFTRLDRGIASSDERRRVGEYLQTWLEQTKRPSLRPSTYRSYAGLIRGHILPALGNVVLSRLTPDQVEAFLNQMSASGLAPHTVQRARAVLRTALSQAERRGYVPRNVAALVDGPRIAQSEIIPMAPDEVGQFLEGVSGDRLAALYTVAVGTGMRLGEILGLRWSDVDLSAGQVRVEHALQRIDGRLVLTEPKSVRSRRTLSLPATCRRALERHRIAQLEERLAAGDAWRQTDFVFATTTGAPLDASTVNHQFHRHLERLGMPSMRFHDLRHTCASLLVSQGVDLRVVMQTLGHSQISLTANTYTHLRQAIQQEAAERINAVPSAG
jgi:integrase